MNSVLGNHHPTPSHGPDGAVPTMADDLGEPAPLWPHDPDAKEVSCLTLTWAGGQRGLLVSVEVVMVSLSGLGRWDAWHLVRETCTRHVGDL